MYILYYFLCSNYHMFQLVNDSLGKVIDFDEYKYAFSSEPLSVKNNSIFVIILLYELIMFEISGILKSDD